jgi:hypothetical protein
MGTFGLCDYLAKKNIPVKLLNLALYSRDETAFRLSQYVDLFQPTHVGIVFHWQETTEGVLEVGEYIHTKYKGVRSICGGFTAGYFGKSFLKHAKYFDYIIKGDPERPMELLLEGTDLSEIPNMIYRGKRKLFSNKVSYQIDQETLSEISFSEMTHLYDYDLYIKAFEEKLGFPIFIGRGCVFNCRYCGGSSMSYRVHSGKREPVERSVKSVIKDLKRIKDFTKKIYMCYENDRRYIKNLFKAIKQEKSLIKTFQLNYGAWQLFDEEFLELYRDTFILDSKDKPVFELSPEVFNDKGRKSIKRNTVPYSIKDIIENQKLINEYVGDSVNTSIFFSRYHDVSKTYADIRAEIIGIYRLKNKMLCSNMHNVHVAYDHLSTDVASQYWNAHMENPKDFNTLLSSIKRLNSQEYHNFPVNNLCLYIPETLKESEVIRCELLITLLKTFEIYFYELFHIVLQCLDEEFIDIIEKVISEKYSLMSEDIFKKFKYGRILSDITKSIVQEEGLISKIPFLEDLSELFVKKALSMEREGSARDLPEISYATLNRDFISIHEHDYLDLSNFLKRLEREGPHGVVKEKTVFIFLSDDILSMPNETYNETLKAFEEGMSLVTYYDLMKKRGIFTPLYHERLIQRLLQNNVLS